MIQIRRTFYWHWRPQVHRIGMGFNVYLPGLWIQVGHHSPPCRECGSRDKILCWDEYNPGAAICPDCCNHPDYEYERAERRHFCVECGIEPPYDWIGYDPD